MPATAVKLPWTAFFPEAVLAKGLAYQRERRVQQLLIEGSRIAVRFAYEWHDDSGQWFRSYGNENWEFDGDGLITAVVTDAKSGDLLMVAHMNAEAVARIEAVGRILHPPGWIRNYRKIRRLRRHGVAHAARKRCQPG